MATEAVDPRWPKILSLTGHELRNSIGVVGGYLRMVLSNRAGPVNDQQRHMLEEAEKGCARLSALLSEVSELSALEGGTAPFNRKVLNLRDVLAETVETIPDLPGREIVVELHTGNGAANVEGDATRLRAALMSVIVALRRELISSDRLMLNEHVRAFDGKKVAWIAIGDPARAAELSKVDEAALTRFDEWRGGVGLSLVIARRIINAHGASIWSPKKEETKEEATKEEQEEAVRRTKAAAVIAIPVS